MPEMTNESERLIDEGEERVDEQKFKNGLHCIGKTYNNSRHAFLSLSIPESGLSTINGVQKYIYLQNIDVSGNNLTTLRPLSSIRHLIKLNASNNKLKYMFDF